MPDSIDLASGVANFFEMQRRKKEAARQALLDSLAIAKQKADEQHATKMEEHWATQDSLAAQPAPVKKERFTNSFGNIIEYNPVTGETRTLKDENGIPLKAYQNPVKPEKADVEFDRKTGTFIDKTNQRVKKAEGYTPVDKNKGKFAETARAQRAQNVAANTQIRTQLAGNKPQLIDPATAQKESNYIDFYGQQGFNPTDSSYTEPGASQPQAGAQSEPEFNYQEDAEDFVKANPDYQYILNDPSIKGLPRRGR